MQQQEGRINNLILGVKGLNALLMLFIHKEISLDYDAVIDDYT